MNDPDYQDNQARAQRAWRERNPDYWRKYRDTHPEYLERNRRKQRERNGRQKDGQIAKMDVSSPAHPFPSGIYRLVPMAAVGIAKMDAWMVEITVLSASPPSSPEYCKERT